MQSNPCCPHCQAEIPNLLPLLHICCHTTCAVCCSTHLSLRILKTVFPSVFSLFSSHLSNVDALLKDILEGKPPGRSLITRLDAATPQRYRKPTVKSLQERCFFFSVEFLFQSRILTNYRIVDACMCAYLAVLIKHSGIVSETVACLFSPPSALPPPVLVSNTDTCYVYLSFLFSW